MSDYSFSLASYNDISEISGVYRSLIGTPGCTWDMEYPSRETAAIDYEKGTLYILKHGERILAVASAGDFGELGHLPWKPKNPCELARIGVVPDMQGKGIGTIMLKNIFDAVKEKGFDGIRMLVSITNYAALALYEKNGFERCGETFMFDTDFYCYQISFSKE